MQLGLGCKAETQGIKISKTIFGLKKFCDAIKLDALSYADLSSIFQHSLLSPSLLS